MPFGDASYKAPHLPFVETFNVEDGTTAEDVLVEKEDAGVRAEEGELGFEEVDARGEPEELAALEHVPHEDWQPLPQ